ncbi:kelch domain-containing protein 10 [Nilaparvata lugens]|uniref:kelch domain-containing protein 10 n=1 Tax=Nilaparvata lugens TaxID=108931 RepID=UPI00193EB0BF|nr:kelch domain-containing protein 10 [Nilaparvata lugens]
MSSSNVSSELSSPSRIINNLFVSTPKEYAFKLYKFDKCFTKGGCTPKPRSGHRIVCDEDNLYSYGGYNPKITVQNMGSDSDWQISRPLFKELWRLNLVTHEWEKLKCKNIPNVLASNAVALSGKILMVFGGTGFPFGVDCNRDLFLCNLSDRNCLEFTRVITKGELPTSGYGQAIFVDGQNFYTVGGTTGFEYSADIHCLNLKTRTWDQVYICNGKPNEPAARYRHELGFHNARLYVLGGGTAQEVFGFDEIPCFDLRSRCWDVARTKPDEVHGFPLARRCHSCVQVADHSGQTAIFILGGYDSELVMADMWRLELSSLQWCKLADRLPQGVYFHSSAVTPQGKIYTFGGINMYRTSTQRSADVHCVWVKIPKLKEICWEALQHYCPNLYQHPISLLLDSGIPQEFLKRLS